MMRFLDWLDESAAGVIRLAYLLAGVIAVASYFSDGRVPTGLARLLGAVLPWTLAGALEIHTYLSARRVRAAWQDKNAAAPGSLEGERATSQMRVNLWILAALLAFSMYNQLQYLAATWTPPHTPLTPPGPWAYLIRAIITPAAFMAAAFLAPMGEGLAVQVQSEAHRLAAATFKVASAQWKRRLREMERAGQDVTGALVQLVDDPTERRVIAAIWQAMHPERDGATLAAQVEQLAAPTVSPVSPDRPPTGPGSPTIAPARADAPAVAERIARPAVLQLTPETPRRRRTAASGASGSAASVARSRKTTKGAKLADEEVERRARATWRPGMTVPALRDAAHISQGAASKWRRVLMAEGDRAGDLAQ